MGQAKEITKRIYSFLWFDGKGMDSDNKNQSYIGFDDLSVKKGDLMFLFVRHVESVFSQDAIAPAEMALVECVREINPHWEYVLKREDDSEVIGDVHDADIEGDQSDQDSLSG